MLYLALEFSNKTWRLALSDGAKSRQVSGPAADLAKLVEAVAKAKERFKLPVSARVVSCYEAGRDGFWLHRHLRNVGIENEVIDAASIQVSRRLRHVKADRLNGDRLLAKLVRHHTGERDGWSVVRAPSIEDEDARRLHRELERLKRERLAHRVRMQSLLVIQGIRLKPGKSAALPERIQPEAGRRYTARRRRLVIWTEKACTTSVDSICSSYSSPASSRTVLGSSWR